MFKYLMPILLLSACCPDYHKLPLPKFNFGQEVEVYDGFYKGIKGTINSHDRCNVQTESGKVVASWCYKILSINKMHMAIEATVSEQELSKNEL